VRLIEEVATGLLPGKIAALGVSPGEILRSPLAWTTGTGRTRAFLKVQDGCNRRCAFCIVPSLRGSERSAPAAEVEEAIRTLGAQGVPEVVLCGVHLAAFGERGESLVALLERLESRPPACRVRLSSLEPMEAGEALIDLVAAGRVVVPHLHLPLQSGSDAVLRRMRRGMTTARYRTLLDRAWRGNPWFHLATDVIAGFPGETDAEFSETEALLRDLPLASLHVFPFSPRSGTVAAGLAEADGVPRSEVTRRAARLRALDSRIRRSFARSHDGRHADLVCLAGGVGLTETYVEVALTAGRPPAGSRFRARLALLSDGTLAAHPEDRPPDRLRGF
jgi:threonylcarbamoyladenosine tRNA methylthiotransferase MtaB